MTIKLNNETRARWNFVVPKDLHYAVDGIDIRNGLASFPRDDEAGENKKHGYKIFASQDECIEWVERNMPVKETGGRTKSLYNVKTAKVAADGSDFQLIKQFMVNPDRFKPEDILVYKSYLAHNFCDRDGERFSLQSLNSMNASIVGKSKLFGHDHGAPGFARYFKSEILKMTADECLKMLGEKVGKKTERNIRLAAELDGGINWMVPSFYMPADEEVIAKRIDMGIYFFESIGFRCRNRVEFKDPQDPKKVLWYEYINTEDDEAEALEGSYVWLGSQFGAGSRKSFEMDGEELPVDDVIKPYAHEHACRLLEPGQFSRFSRMTRKHKGKEYSAIIGYRANGSSDDQAYRYPIDTWTPEEARKHCMDHDGISFEPARPKESGKSKLGGKMKLKLLTIDKEVELTEIEIGKFIAEAEAEVKKVSDRAEVAEQAMTAVKAVLGDDISAVALKTLKDKADLGAKLHERIVVEAATLSVQAGFTENSAEKVDAEKKLLAALPLDILESHMAKSKAVVDKKYPPRNQIADPEKGSLDLDTPFVPPY